jgi:hypothetical protein
MRLRGCDGCEQELTRLPVGGLQIAIYRFSRLLAQLKPIGISCLRLTDSGAINGDSMRRHILNLEADDIIASELGE